MTCPICARPTEARWRPFCSKRCADIDLGRWMFGGYALPGPELEDGEVPDPDDISTGTSTNGGTS